MGCCLWGRTESDTTEATQQQQQALHCFVQAFSGCGEQRLLFIVVASLAEDHGLEVLGLP